MGPSRLPCQRTAFLLLQPPSPLHAAACSGCAGSPGASSPTGCAGPAGSTGPAVAAAAVLRLPLGLPAPCSAAATPRGGRWYRTWGQRPPTPAPTAAHGSPRTCPCTTPTTSAFPNSRAGIPSSCIRFCRFPLLPVPSPSYVPPAVAASALPFPRLRVPRETRWPPALQLWNPSPTGRSKWATAPLQHGTTASAAAPSSHCQPGSTHCNCSSSPAAATTATI
mmetsp:Transcript_14818/g.19439  ORF Transcript_14818/g.19439 Transcript_14818/m.19439 type:complete len:222 (-) Transcript_14818:2149-2814(-)